MIVMTANKKMRVKSCKNGLELRTLMSVKETEKGRQIDETRNMK